jgi:hypothetical protein
MESHPPPKDELEKGIRDMLGAFAAGLDAEDRLAYRAVSLQPAVIAGREALAAMDLRAFRWALQRPFDQVLDGLLAEAFPGSLEARYLFRRANYVERHFRSVVQVHEGLACSADKTRTILAALLAHFVERKPISFDRTGSYTFHLPTKVFVDETSILTFFVAVRSLDHGDPRAYLACLGTLGKDRGVASPADATARSS